jgi:hypothetical protein
MKADNASPVMQKRIAGLSVKTSQRHLEHVVASPLGYEGCKAIRRRPPFELKLGRFWLFCRKRKFVLCRTD